MCSMIWESIVFIPNNINWQTVDTCVKCVVWFSSKMKRLDCWIIGNWVWVLCFVCNKVIGSMWGLGYMCVWIGAAGYGWNNCSYALFLVQILFVFPVWDGLVDVRERGGGYFDVDLLFWNYIYMVGWCGVIVVGEERGWWDRVSFFGDGADWWWFVLVVWWLGKWRFIPKKEEKDRGVIMRDDVAENVG